MNIDSHFLQSYNDSKQGLTIVSSIAIEEIIDD